MAKRPATPVPVNPEVRFESTDVESSGVVWFGILLGTAVLCIVGGMLWFGSVLQVRHSKPDPLDLPRASVDANRLPPEPRLEGAEDVRLGNIQISPPRAAEYLDPQIRRLEQGDPAQHILPIEQSMDAVMRSQAVRKSGDRTAPTTFTIRLPSKAASGQRTTGGQ